MIPSGLRIAIVGTRAPTPEIEIAVRQLVCSLSYDMSGRQEITVVSGGAPGVDSLAVATARKYGLRVAEHGPEKYLEPLLPGMRHDERAVQIALMRRNGDIVEDCEHLVAFPGPESRGTWDAVKKAIAAGKLWEVRRG